MSEAMKHDELIERPYGRQAMPDTMTPDEIAKVAEGWHTGEAKGLEAAISQFKKDLPGWWFTVGECQVSADASCGPTREAPEHIALIPKDDRFDSGFHVDLPQPAMMATALDTIRSGALEAINHLMDKPNP